MSTRLLHLQTSLLEYLTSAAAIFGHRRALPADHDLHGVDIGRLRLEARFSFDKRLAKISSVFPRTFAIFTGDWAPVLREFVDAQPPMDIGRLGNAQQFFDFLSKRSDHAQMEPPWLLDVAACELACAQVRAYAKAGESAIADPVAGAVRCRPGAVLLRCTYDVRSVFEDHAGDGAGVERHTLLVVFIPPHVDRLQICDIGREVFDLLSACRQWTDPATLGLVRGSDELVSDLAGRGLLEVR
jgi:hypothetical protein